MIETPLSSYSVRYDSLGLWIKLFTLFANTYIKDTVWFALLMIVIGAILLVLGIKVPAYHDQRGMRLVDPNCLQNGIDAAILWVYVCGFVGAVVVRSSGLSESNWVAILPIGAPICMILTYVSVYKSKPYEETQSRRMTQPSPASATNNAQSVEAGKSVRRRRGRRCSDNDN